MLLRRFDGVNGTTRCRIVPFRRSKSEVENERHARINGYFAHFFAAFFAFFPAVVLASD